MSERMLEIVRDADGRFLATVDDRFAPIEVTTWNDVRRLRGKNHVVDHWAPGVREAFIELHGHPFDDWWAALSPACAQALLVHPYGEIPTQFHSEVKRTLSHQPRQPGLELQGSSFTRELQDYIAAKAS